ncbi:PQQ-dependent sugar dehydrogenase [Oceanobacillus jordanicus]|uniref:Sorbosone dehydrogenase family protein n=1 Tax=Oceanobacillus jordanicus TaxID=2867266 RepID=A0AAW5B4L6_9BACI|nr:sorbosone dehydrogenase family protein [Oceanobacillus jordanicus]MCG3419346.1 sorbosone dehydrogenase family protein [Oceanobacillus jordanicus]
MRFTGIAILCTFFVILTACSNDERKPEPIEPEQPAEETSGEAGENEDAGNEGENIEQVATNLEAPWAIEKHGGNLYVSERPGAIVTITKSGQTRKPVEFERDLSQQSEAGLLGIAIPEDFSSSEIAYAYYSYEQDGTYYQRVIELEEREEAWHEVSTILDRIPGGQVHQGGRIKIGPDEKLYVTTGDASVPENAQDVESLAGKILRINTDGSVPEDNPFQNSYIYSYGHRNPQGMAWDEAGSLYATAHGSNAHDEINLIKPGENYGWPVIQGDETEGEMVTPLAHSGEETWAPSGMTSLHGSFFFATLSGQSLKRFNLKNETISTVLSDFGRIRDVYADSGGLYFITNNTDGRGSPSEEDDQLIFLKLPTNQLHESQ